MKSDNQHSAERSPSTLSALLVAAAQNPDEWHTSPELPLALRVMASPILSTVIAFEFRDQNHRDRVFRYRYYSCSHSLFSWNHDLASWSHDSLVHSELKADDELPHDSDALARLIATLVHYHPELLQRLQAPVSSSLPAVTLSLGRNFRETIEQWLGPYLQPMSIRFSLRFVVAFGGSFTFWTMLLAFFIFEYSELTEDADIIRIGFLAELFLVVLWLPFIFSGMFAGIISWGAPRLGPIRMYLTGFLLPFSIWGLLSITHADIKEIKNTTEIKNTVPSDTQKPSS